MPVHLHLNISLLPAKPGKRCAALHHFVWYRTYLSLQVFPEEEEVAVDLLDVEQREVYANLCSLFPNLDPAFLKVAKTLRYCH